MAEFIFWILYTANFDTNQWWWSQLNENIWTICKHLEITITKLIMVNAIIGRHRGPQCRRRFVVQARQCVSANQANVAASLFSLFSVLWSGFVTYYSHFSDSNMNSSCLLLLSTLHWSNFCGCPQPCVSEYRQVILSRSAGSLSPSCKS